VVLGSTPLADIVVSGGVVTSVSIRDGGSFYVVGDVLSASTADLGNRWIRLFCSG